ncbi:hypothetical protein [Aliiroseovarius sp. PrR006]|uniref:hypothetical protein n=1 Tax=Aliiroseovarius sp. PrR006 TaxID=2706883 RepID=UPI0013D80266|nr:hypothetical protein [Aliiroseovarius sp. PrR006]NDW53606.1 hypothetical protein [Aliiroseovarius sp. PrR006]
MTHLAKLAVKSVVRTARQDPTMQRRQKLVAGIDEQLNVAAAALKGEDHQVKRKTWGKDEHGEKVLVDRMRKVRPWFFEQDGGWYVQCKYGNKVLALGKGNAVFVKTLKDVQGALGSLKGAVEAGELDDAIAVAAKRKSI